MKYCTVHDPCRQRSAKLKRFVTLLAARAERPGQLDRWSQGEPAAWGRRRMACRDQARRGGGRVASPGRSTGDLEVELSPDRCVVGRRLLDLLHGVVVREKGAVHPGSCTAR